MLFNSPIFLFAFLPSTVGFYVLLRQFAGPRAVLGLLLSASLLFYAWWNPVYLPLLCGIAVFNFLVARSITAQRSAGRTSWVRLLLIFGIAVDLLVLGYFKYTDFLIDMANTLVRTDFLLQHIILPLGISFFTFQKIAYLVDSARGKVAEHDFLEYCFFVMFFPQLLAGPITHHSEIFSQIKGPRAFAIKPSNLVLGLTIFVIGLFKKVVLADNFAPYVSSVYDAAIAGQTLDFFTAWQGAIAFKFQLYFDFSGYSEMALGAARLFGIQLPLNFNSPYRALNVVDFWRRWHYDVVALAARLRLHPARGEPLQHRAALFQPDGDVGAVRPVARRGVAFRLLGLLAGRRHGHEPCLATRVAADQRLVVEHGVAAGHVLRSDDGAGDASSAVDGRGVAGLSRHVQPARCVARCPGALGPRARLAGSALRWTSGFGRSTRTRAVADLLAGAPMVPAEHAPNSGAMAARFQLWRGRTGT